jgi:hypothetical protein
MDAPERPDDSESESWVLSPSLDKVVTHRGSRHIVTHALECIECGRKSRTKCRRNVLGELVVSSGTEHIHHNIGRCRGNTGDLNRLNILHGRKKNVKKVGISELRDSGESDILGGRGGRRGSHSNSRHLIRDSSKKQWRSD